MGFSETELFLQMSVLKNLHSEIVPYFFGKAL